MANNLSFNLNSKQFLFEITFQLENFNCKILFQSYGINVLFLILCHISENVSNEDQQKYF